MRVGSVVILPALVIDCYTCCTHDSTHLAGVRAWIYSAYCFLQLAGPWVAVLWLQHPPGPEICGRGLLQPRGHHLHPLAQGLQASLLHQDREHCSGHRADERMRYLQTLPATRTARSEDPLLCLRSVQQRHPPAGRGTALHLRTGGPAAAKVTAVI